VREATDADCAIVIVQDDATESTDRPDLALPGSQNELIERVAAVADRTVVVCRTSGPIEMEWIDRVDALLTTWYPGQADGEALASVLFGDRDPGGRLPISIGVSAADSPTTDERAFPGTDGAVHYDESVFMGYRYFDHENREPRFPFGHGLSYTTVEYGTPTLDIEGEHEVKAGSRGIDADGPIDLSVKVPVRNVGDRAGTEVVQCYVIPPDSAVPRPPRELKGFDKIELEPGEKRHVSIGLDWRAFRHYETDRGWILSSGRYTIALGRSSRDQRATITVEIR
jgi:beta-glucosidase